MREEALVRVNDKAGVHVEAIRDWDRFSELEPEWNGLLSRSNANSLFATWEWISAWRRVVEKYTRPLALTVRDADGGLVGVAPFYFSGLRLGKVIPYRTLRVMADYATGAVYPDWIVDRECEYEATRAIAGALRECGREWDSIWMPRVAGWTGARDRILRACGEAGFFCHERTTGFGWLELPTDMEEYRESLSRSQQKQLYRDRKRFLQHDGARFSWCWTQDQLPRFLNALFDLNSRRWERKGGKGTFQRKPSEALFYRNFTRIALEKGWLRLFGMEEKGELKAVSIGYVYDGVFYGIQSGFDPDSIKGVGNVLLEAEIEACICEGVRCYDFSIGMTETKRKWLAVERTGYDLFIGERKPKNRLLFWKPLWPTGRFLFLSNPSALAGAGDVR